MSIGLTPSEKLVASLCNRAFLRLWTHPNPVGKKGKELCDCLIVCGPHIVIVSVKEIQFRDTGDQTGMERWHRAAIEASAQQIWGAERWLDSVDQFERGDGRVVHLPPKKDRKYHRISISLGARGEAYLRWGDLGHGFVHVFDELSLEAIFEYLDTITDFINYLTAVEALFNRGFQFVFSGSGPEDLLALYVHHGEDFGLPKEVDGPSGMIVLTGGLWADLSKSPEYKALLADRQASYSWDRLIDHYVDDLLSGGMFDMHSNEVTTSEEALVAMALQPRGYRAVLVEAFIEYLESKPNENAKIASRAAVGANATAFVFLTGPHSDRERRSQELAMRCHVVRGRAPSVSTVVGIATDKPGESKGHSTDIVYIHLPEWSDQHEKVAVQIQSELGYFKNVEWRKKSES